MRVLIAEADADARAELVDAVEELGLQPLLAENGHAALDAMLGRDAPEIAIVDWEMPELGGTDLARRIRVEDRERDPYIIVVMSDATGEDLGVALESGVDDVLGKPLSKAATRARLHSGVRTVELRGALRQALAALEHQAAQDPLTGIANREAVLDRLRFELRRIRRIGSHLSVGICGVDNLEAVNATHGVFVGDDVLAGCAQTVDSAVGPVGHVGRFAGDEFLVLAPGTDRDAGLELFERVRRAVEALPVATRGPRLSTTVSIGVATSESHEDLDTLLMAASKALQSAKSEGKNRVCCAV
jgi:diguanylate cyclase (GGDEF)-like protein